MDLQRRLFLKKSLLGTLAVTSGSAYAGALAPAKKRKFGVILGLVGDQMKEDAIGTLKFISEVGYREVEFGTNYYGLGQGAFKDQLKALKLKAVAGGSSITNLEEDFGKFVEDAHYFGKKYVVCYWPWDDGGLDKKADDFKVAAENLDKLGARFKAEGLKFAFHNHDKEFVDVGNGQLGYDLILEMTDPAHVTMEIDLYWIIKGNADPIKYFQKYPGRFDVCHVKDMDDTSERSFEIVGQGIIDFPEIFSYAKLAGLKHFIVEQDRAPEPLRTVKESFDYLNKLKF